jgi:hypothetical protein
LVLLLWDTKLVPGLVRAYPTIAIHYTSAQQPVALRGVGDETYNYVAANDCAVGVLDALGRRDPGAAGP